jgi:hypothetical protein
MYDHYRDPRSIPDDSTRSPPARRGLQGEGCAVNLWSLMVAFWFGIGLSVLNLWVLTFNVAAFGQDGRHRTTRPAIPQQPTRETPR